MPTPPLSVLHALLHALDLPLAPPTLPSTPPTLLLLLLERLDRRQRLPLSLRRPTTPDAEISLTKCVLGALASLLGMDLSAVDPSRVVAGSEADLAVVVMALAVLARRRGLKLVLDDGEWDEDWTDSLGDGEVGEGDISLMDMDADGVLLPERGWLEPLPMESFITPPRAKPASPVEVEVEDDGLDPLSPARLHPLSPGSSAGRGASRQKDKTVLQCMIEEFGLEPGG